MRGVIAVLALLLIVAVIVGITITYRYHKAKRVYSKQEAIINKVREQEEIKRDADSRRRITLKTKREVFERDNRTCQICGISYEFVEGLCEGLGDYLLLEVDHIQSVAQGGSGKEVDNLQCLCWRCNRKKGGKKSNEEVKNSIAYGIDKLTAKGKLSH